MSHIILAVHIPRVFKLKHTYKMYINGKLSTQLPKTYVLTEACYRPRALITPCCVFFRASGVKEMAKSTEYYKNIFSGISSHISSIISLILVKTYTIPISFVKINTDTKENRIKEKILLME